jgi:hypothetical protein
MKRIIPNICVHFVEGADLSVLQENEHVQDIVLGSVVLGIKEAVKLRKKEATIVELNSSGNYVSISKENWKQSLETAQQYYVKLEEYEICADIQKLIESLISYGSTRSYRKTPKTNRPNNRSRKSLKTS